MEANASFCLLQTMKQGFGFIVESLFERRALSSMKSATKILEATFDKTPAVRPPTSYL